MISVLQKQTPMSLSCLGGTNDSFKALNCYKNRRYCRFYQEKTIKCETVRGWDNGFLGCKKRLRPGKGDWLSTWGRDTATLEQCALESIKFYKCLKIIDHRLYICDLA